jgi:hypothetical protein
LFNFYINIFTATDMARQLCWRGHPVELYSFNKKYRFIYFFWMATPLWGSP